MIKKVRQSFVYVPGIALLIPMHQHRISAEIAESLGTTQINSKVYPLHCKLKLSDVW